MGVDLVSEREVQAIQPTGHAPHETSGDSSGHRSYQEAQGAEALATPDQLVNSVQEHR